MNLGEFERVLGNLFEWKLVTTSGLHQEVFGGQSPKTVYLKLREMKKRGMIKQVCDPSGTKWAWTLTKKGYQSLPYRQSMREEGFASEAFDHDLICSAIQMGNCREFPGRAITCKKFYSRLHDAGGQRFSV